MFFHAMKYEFLTLIRDKSYVFWCAAFPLLLGTMFHFAFGGLGADESFEPIPVAVVIEEPEEDFAASAAAAIGLAEAEGIDPSVYLPDAIDGTDISFDTFSPEEIVRSFFDTLSAPGEDQFLEVTYATEDEARLLLNNKDVYGIITAELPEFSDFANAKTTDSLPDALLYLQISSEMNSDPLYQSILSAFVEQFNMEYSAIISTVLTHPEKLSEMMENPSDNMETNYLATKSLGADSLDESLTYFFNLIAMTCLYAAMIGNNIAIHNQANLSALGARRNISPVHRLVSILGELSAALILEFGILLFTLAYLILVLNVNFGTQLGLVTLTTFCGCLTGISLGFMIGCIGRFNKETKFGILMAVIMVGCFLSGLMVGNMRMYVEKTCPLINRINPAALISDALYSLIIYPSHTRFFSNIAGLLLLSALFCLCGFTMVRRKKYASL